MNYLRRHWFWIVLAVVLVIGLSAWSWYFPSGESKNAKSQAVGTLLSFLIAAMLAAVTWLYVQATRDMLAEMKAESSLREPNIEVTVRGAKHNGWRAQGAAEARLELSVWLHIQNLSRTPFSVNLLAAGVDGMSAKLTSGEFIVGETTTQKTGHVYLSSTPTETFVYLSEGGAFDGKLALEFNVSQPEPIGRELAGRVLLGFPRGQRREVSFSSRA